MPQSNAEAAFLYYWRIYCPDAPAPICEYRFDESRRWRFDFAWPDKRVAVEIDGGAWMNGRHTRGGGFEKDLEKLNAAVYLGWRVYRFTPGMLERDSYNLIKMVLTNLQK